MEKKAKKKGSAFKFFLIILILVLMILALSGAVLYLLYGEEIYGNLARWGFVPERPETEEVQSGPGGDASPDGDGADADAGEDADSEAESGEPAEGEETTGEETAGEEAAESGEAPPSEAAPSEETESEPPAPAAPAMEYAEADALPYGLSLSKTDITIRALGTVNTLFAGGGNGSYIWISQNPAVATVDQEGHVTSVSSGNTRILVTDGEMKGVCVVRIAAGLVKSDAALNTTDVTRRVSEGSFQLSVTGASASVGWMSNNAAVATVDANGVVTPVAPGTAIITAYWADEYLLCTVRVPAEAAPAEAPAA